MKIFLCLIVMMISSCSGQEVQGAATVKEIVDKIEEAIEKERLDLLRIISLGGKDIPANRKPVAMAAKGADLKRFELVTFRDAAVKWPFLFNGDPGFNETDLMLYLLWEGRGSAKGAMKMEQIFPVVLVGGRYYLKFD